MDLPYQSAMNTFDQITMLSDRLTTDGLHHFVGGLRWLALNRPAMPLPDAVLRALQTTEASDPGYMKQDIPSNPA